MSDSPAAGAASAGVKGSVTTSDLDRAERAIARRSAETRAVVPHVEFGVEVDMEPARGRSAGTTARLVRAAALALAAVPRANGAYRDGRYELYARVNIGVTFAEGNVYVIPTLFDADRKSLEELETELTDLRKRAREGALTPAELSGATFTMSDSAEHAVATLTPLIVPPQAGALAAGPVREVPVVRGGAVVPGRAMTLTLAADHRILYGAHAVRFLEEVKARFEEDA